MVESDPDATEARRLERLWSGRFGDAYVARNLGSYEHRGKFWSEIIPRLECRGVLEVGCNVGGNLKWIARIVPGPVVGIDVNKTALTELRTRSAGILAVRSRARQLPFLDASFDLVFTMGVLIHQPDDALHGVISEVARCSRRWVLAGEYYAQETVEVPYRGVRDALFKRDYGWLFSDIVSRLALRQSGFLGRDTGWDDVTWWLFERT